MTLSRVECAALGWIAGTLLTSLVVLVASIHQTRKGTR